MPRYTANKSQGKPKPSVSANQARNNPQRANPRRELLQSIGIKSLKPQDVTTYMVSEERALKEALIGSGIRVERKGRDVVLTLPGDRSFSAGKDDLMPSIQAYLSKIAAIANTYNATYIDIIGHADSSGVEAINRELSEGRAKSTAAYLVSRSVPHQRLFVAGLGSDRPLVSNDTANGRIKNRRVEIILRPLTQ